MVNSNHEHDYVKSCLNSLSDPNFYEELPTDPNLKYGIDLDEKIDDLLSSNIIMNLKLLNNNAGLVLLTSMAYLKYTKTKSLTDFLLYDQYLVDSIPVLQNPSNLLMRF